LEGQTLIFDGFDADDCKAWYRDFSPIVCLNNSYEELTIIGRNMETKIVLCKYSFHSKNFSLKKSGLKCYLFRLQTESKCQALVNGVITTVNPKDLLLYKPGDPYELIIGNHSNSPASGDYFVVCYGSWLDQWWNSRSRPQLLHLRNIDRLLAVWKELVLETQQVSDHNNELQNYLLRSLCLLIDRVTDESPPPDRSSYAAIRMKNYIDEHALEPLKIKKVAEYVKLSDSRATHLFKEFYGVSMIQYAMDVRLNNAIGKLVYSNLTLEQIALSSGFSSYSYFYKVFSKRYGVSPSNYMKTIFGQAEQLPIDNF
jgi:AraC family transcriptional regulator of arabinose operon